MITFYDLASKDSIKTWSINTWKTRYVLNLKQLPYKTVYLEFPEIKGTVQQAGASPTADLDGAPVYSVPTIVDDATGVAVCDSFKIAEYLDKQYPETPRAFPPGSEALQAAFYNQFLQMFNKIFSPVLITKTLTVLNPVSYDYYIRVREAMFGKPFGQILPAGEDLDQLWKKTKEFFDLLEAWYDKSGGPYFMGDTPSFADFVVGSLVLSLKIFDKGVGEDWKRVSTWNDGRWVRLLKDLEKYANTDA